MPVFEARDMHTNEVYKFRKFAALVRRLGGANWSVEHNTAYDPLSYTVLILRKNRWLLDTWEVVGKVRVPAAAIYDHD